MKKLEKPVIRLKEVMREKDVSRSELAESVGVSTTTITNITAHYNLPTIQLLLRVSEVLDVDVRELFYPTKGGMIAESELEEGKRLIMEGMERLG